MKHVYWVQEGKLAGRAGPVKFPWNADELAAAGIGGVVSLDGPIDPEPLTKAGIKHLPLYQPMIILYHPADQREFLSNVPAILNFIEECNKEGRGAMIHCYYGCDRTGAMLASCLVARENLTAEQAIARVRKANPYAMAVEGYDHAVHLYAQMHNQAAHNSKK